MFWVIQEAMRSIMNYFCMSAEGYVSSLIKPIKWYHSKLFLILSDSHRSNSFFSWLAVSSGSVTEWPVVLGSL
jgi:hypothetical protein